MANTRFRKASLTGVVLLGILAWAPLPSATAQNRIPSRSAGADGGKRDNKDKLDPILVLAQQFRFPGISDPKATLDDALQMLQACYGIPFDIHERAFYPEGLKDPGGIALFADKELEPLEGTLQSVLKRILGRVPCDSGAIFLIRGRTLEITTRAAAQAEIWGLDYHGPYLPVVNFMVKDMPLNDALAQLSAQVPVNIFCTAHGGKVTTKVTGRLTNVPVDTAVRLLAKQAGLRVVQRDNVLVVVTRAQEWEMEKKLKAELPDPAHPDNYRTWRRSTLQPTVRLLEDQEGW